MASLELNETPENVDIFHHGDRYTVTVGQQLRRDKWKGGTFVEYVENQSVKDTFTVERSSGVHACGFLLYGSEDYTNARQSTYRNFTSYQNTSVLANSLGTAVLTLVSGGGRYLFKQFEKNALAPNGTRTGGEITYSLNEELKISENGLLCNDSDANLLVATGGAKTLVVGICCFVPSEKTQKLGLDYKF